jgi:hypothetical protein
MEAIILAGAGPMVLIQPLPSSESISFVTIPLSFDWGSFTLPRLVD